LEILYDITAKVSAAAASHLSAIAGPRFLNHIVVNPDIMKYFDKGKEAFFPCHKSYSLELLHRAWTA
jgi:hypothetical protein